MTDNTIKNDTDASLKALRKSKGVRTKESVEEIVKITSEEIAKITSTEAKDRVIAILIKEHCLVDLAKLLLPHTSSEELKAEVERYLDDPRGEKLFEKMISEINGPNQLPDQPFDLTKFKKIQVDFQRYIIFNALITINNLTSAKTIIPFLTPRTRPDAIGTFLEKSLAEKMYDEAIDLACTLEQNEKQGWLDSIVMNSLEADAPDEALKAINQMHFDKIFSVTGYGTKDYQLYKVFYHYVKQKNYKDAEKIADMMSTQEHIQQFISKESSLAHLMKIYEDNNQKEEVTRLRRKLDRLSL